MLHEDCEAVAQCTFPCKQLIAVPTLLHCFDFSQRANLTAENFQHSIFIFLIAVVSITSRRILLHSNLSKKCILTRLYESKPFSDIAFPCSFIIISVTMYCLVVVMMTGSPDIGVNSFRMLI